MVLVAAAAWLAPGALRAQIQFSDFIGGGDGTGTADPAVVGMNPDTGQWEFAYNNAAVPNTGDNPQAVDPADSTFIDSVFIITDPKMEINTAGVTFDFTPGDATGGTYNYIIKDATHDVDKADYPGIMAGGLLIFSTAVSIHASAGITFNLEEIRAVHGAENVKWFSGFAGTDRCNGSISLNIFASDDNGIIETTDENGDPQLAVRVEATGGNQGRPVRFRIPDEAIFLTLAVGALNGSIGCAHGVFADPVVASFPVFPPERFASNPGDPNDCPPSTSGPISVKIKVPGGGAEVATVTETARGPFDASAITADHGGTAESLFSGFIRHWLLLGPLTRDGGAAPGEDVMRADYMIDADGNGEDIAMPAAGDQVLPDFLGLSAATGLARGSNLDINPDDTPTWAAWEDPDDTIDFNDFYGGDVDNIMMYGLVYIDFAEEKDNVSIGYGSDDSIEILFDGVEAEVHNQARGWGGARVIQNTVDLTAQTGPIDAGVHTLMVKVFEGGGGHGFRLTLLDSTTGEELTQGIQIGLTPDVSAPVAFPDPYGARITWNVPRDALVDGIGYDIDIPDGTVTFSGDIAGQPILGSGTYTLTPAPADSGPIADPDFPHAHPIGNPCPGDAVESPSPGAIRITAGGNDIWGSGDQFVYAYKEVTGDFSATVSIADRVMGNSTWGKHGIMARGNCSAGSPYVYCADQQSATDLPNETAFQWRDGQDMGAAWNGSPIPDVNDVTGHANVLRLDRVGNEFIAYGLDEFGDWSGVPGEWFELGRRSDLDGLQLPETVQIGLAVVSHDGCNLITVEFEDWDVTLGTPAQPPKNVTCAGSTGGVDLTWENLGQGTGAISVEVNGENVQDLAEDATSATLALADLDDGLNSIDVVNSAGRSRCTFFNGDQININCGGPALDEALGTDLGDGRLWLEDSDVNPSPFLASPNAHTNDRSLGAFPTIGVADTTLTEPGFIDDPLGSRLFATERWDQEDVVYRIPVPQGDWEVTLLFAEGCCSQGCEDIADPALSGGACRVVDLLVNGQLVADQFSAHVEAQRGMGNALPNANWGIAVAQGPYAVSSTGSIEITVDDLGGGNPPENASIQGISLVKTGGGPVFKRGDADASGAINITDGIFVLNFLFLGGPDPACKDAADADDSGALNITDGIYILNFLFLGGPDPKTPTGTCGPDPTAEDPDLPCDSFGGC